MPRTPKRPCRFPGCPNLCEKDVYCDKHKAFTTDKIRGGAYGRGYDAKWRKVRKLYLQQHPLCSLCQQEGKLTPATVIDHILPHRGDTTLFWDKKNWQPLCKNCHDRKTGSGY